MHLRKLLISAAHSSSASASLLLKQPGHLRGGAAAGHGRGLLGSWGRLLQASAALAFKLFKNDQQRESNRTNDFGSFMMDRAMTVGSSRSRTPVSVLTLRGPAAAAVGLQARRHLGGSLQAHPACSVLRLHRPLPKLLHAATALQPHRLTMRQRLALNSTLTRGSR